MPYGRDLSSYCLISVREASSYSSLSPTDALDGLHQDGLVSPDGLEDGAVNEWEVRLDASPHVAGGALPRRPLPDQGTELLEGPEPGLGCGARPGLI